MQNPRFMQRTETPLQSLYEHNYWLFRLVLPQRFCDSGIDRDISEADIAAAIAASRE